ncbi:hypothetical protein [Bacillus marasmi]|uniref:hypothetical protein n=1 Tax=Bacillus marasmi TaxID=1926279 RepID=UPI0011C89643|nr:hypothetical protein [Bacillus marasmi]
MFRKLTEEDFSVLRGPFESGRQSPTLMGVALFLSIFLQALFWYLEYHFMDNTTYPNAKEIVTYHFWFTAVLIVLSLIYSVPAVFNRSQKIQYLIVILVSQNFGAVSEYILGVFLLAENYYERPEVMLNTFTKPAFTEVYLLLISDERTWIVHNTNLDKSQSANLLIKTINEANWKSLITNLMTAMRGIL